MRRFFEGEEKVSMTFGEGVSFGRRYSTEEVRRDSFGAAKEGILYFWPLVGLFAKIAVCFRNAGKIGRASKPSAIIPRHAAPCLEDV